MTYLSPTPASDPEVLMSLAAVATFRAVSIKTIRGIVARGDLPVHRLGSLLRVSSKDLTEYAELRLVKRGDR